MTKPSLYSHTITHGLIAFYGVREPQAVCQAAPAKAQTQACQRVCLPQRKRKFKIFFPALQKKLKTPVTQTNTTKPRKLNNDNGLQRRWTEQQLPTTVGVIAGLVFRLKVLAVSIFQLLIEI